MINLQETFEKYNDEYCSFHAVEKKLSQRADLHAFMLLDMLVPEKHDIISASEHDEFYLDVDLEKLSNVATESDIITLIRCGVRYDSEFDCLCMFS